MTKPSVADKYRTGGGLKAPVPQKVATPQELAARWNKKTNQIEKLANNISSLRNNVTRDLQSDNEKEWLTALVILTIDKTGERVGNEDSASHGHRGVTGLLKTQVSIDGNAVHFKYTGKSGVKHDKTVTDSKLADGIRRALATTSTKHLFCTSDGFCIKADRVNRYLKDFDVTAKDLRGYSANKWLIEKLSSGPIQSEENARKKDFNHSARQVAQKVGHGLATLKKQYLLPDLETEYVGKGKIINVKDMSGYKSGGDVKKYKAGGAVDDKKDIYKKWHSLVNMSSDEVKKFYDSTEGKAAGLTSGEAHELGIHSGRQSARWIMKMKETPVKDWTDEMYDWAKRQISFISRMQGNKGELYDENGRKTRKYTSLLIWGHNPEKHESGGFIADVDFEKQYEEVKNIETYSEFGENDKGKMYSVAIDISPKFKIIRDYLIAELRKKGYENASSSTAKTGTIYVFPYGVGSTHVEIRIADHMGRGGVYAPTYDITTFDEAKEVIKRIEPFDVVEARYKSQAAKSDLIFENKKKHHAMLKESGFGYGEVERTYQSPDVFMQKHPEYTSIKVTELGKNRFGEMAYKYQFLLPFDGYSIMPAQDYLEWLDVTKILEQGGDIRYAAGGKTNNSYAQRVGDNLLHMGTEAKDWKSLPIIGFKETENDKGQIVNMPVFDFSVTQGFKRPDTLYPAPATSSTDALTNCELCGAKIKNVYHIYDDTHRYTLNVGSECVTHFQEGKSGKEKEREAKIMLAAMLDRDIENLSGIVKADLSKVKTERSYHGDKKVRVWYNMNIGYYTASKHRSEYDIKIGNNIAQVNFDVLKDKRYPITKEISGRHIYDLLTPFNYSAELERADKDSEITKESIDKRLLAWFTRKEKEQTELIPAIVGLLTAFEYPVDFASDYLNNKIENSKVAE